MIVSRHLLLFAIFLANFAFHAWAKESNCVTQSNRPGQCIFLEDCPPMKEIWENPSRRRNDTQFVLKSLCLQLNTRFKVCCDAAESRVCPSIVEPTIAFDCYNGIQQMDCNDYMVNGTIIYPRCNQYHEYSKEHILRPFRCTNGVWDSEVPLCIPGGPLFCQNGWNCDVFLRIGQYRFPANKEKLTVRSTYLSDLFKNGDKEVTIPNTNDVDPTTVQVVFEYMHSDKTINWKFEQTPQIFTLSKIFGMPQIEDECIKILKAQLNKNNFLKYVKISGLLKNSAMTDYIREFIIENFKKIISKEEWLELNYSDIANVFKSDNLRVDSEMQAFEGLKKWAQHNWSQRKFQFQDLLKDIRLTQLSKQFISDNVRPLCDDDLGRCFRLVWNAIEWHNSPESAKKSSQEKPRAFAIEQTVLVVGGRNSKVWSLDIRSKQLSALPRMQRERYSCAAAVVDGFVYVSGGLNDSQVALDTVEQFDPVKQIWSFVAQMPQARFDHAAASWNGNMYLVGGATLEGALNSVHVYNPKMNKWTSIAPMAFARSSCAALVFDDQLFVIGGSTDLRVFSRLTSVIRYNLLNQTWTKGTDLPDNIDGTKAVVLNDKIIIAGGAGSSDQSYEYNPETDRWRQLGSLKHHRHRHNALLVPKSSVINNEISK
ncbi:ectoderm-neural cortex protein 1-like isoform X2 [Arctopsyche grandis]|uniref:ectoderm-neural cortex protein 1-like isoform X2 n=1 Tax=Arctopsyche grandis TaxID=121162 RepID=UPI00406D6B05